MLKTKKKIDLERISTIFVYLFMGFSAIYFFAHKWIVEVINKWARI